MQEYVGHCKECSKQIFCNDGFLNGLVLEDKSLICFDCSKRYPIGEFQVQGEVTDKQIKLWINELINMPERLDTLVSTLNDEQLETPYRENGWTLKQVVHHIADALMNSYIHFKLAITEGNPTIKPYYEDRWAELNDEKNSSINISLLLLKSIIERWGLLLNSMGDLDFKKTFVHPLNGQKRLDEYLGFCVWHGKHHLAQIKSLLTEKDWD